MRSSLYGLPVLLAQIGLTVFASLAPLRVVGQDPGANWIGASNPDIRTPLMRREFTVRAGLTSARVSFTAVGAVEFYLNSHRVGDEILTPAPTQFEKRALFSVVDVTNFLKPGTNCGGLWLAEGQAAITRGPQDRYSSATRRYPGIYAAPAAWLRLELNYRDGTKDVIRTDENWRWSTSPLTYAHFFGGEDYDARLEQIGWSGDGFDARSWRPVVVHRDISVELSERKMPPMRVVQVLKPISRRSLPGGVILFDLGQNIAGFWRIKVRGEAGWVVSVRGAETLDNSIYRGDFQIARGLSAAFVHSAGGFYERDAISRYTMKGGDEETYEPRFFYSGFRYVQVEVPNRAVLKSVELEGCVVHTDVPQVGDFQCSDERLNRLHLNTLWSLKGVMQGAPMSNPHSEKNGWTGDAHLFAKAANSIFVMDSFWEKWLLDLKDAQEVSGGKFFPQVVPTFRAKTIEGPATAVWGAAYPLIAWYQYLYTGRDEVLREHYEPICRWAQYLASTAKDGLVDEIWADHDAPGIDPEGNPLCFGMTPNLRLLLGTAYYERTERVLAEMATVLGRPEESASHRSRADAAAQRLNAQFFNAESGLYVVPPAPGHFPLQTANLVPLQLDIAPPAERARILSQVLNDIRVTHGGHLMTGIIGTKALVEVLVRAREGELLYQLATQPSYPGWGFWLANGATTHWQAWTGKDFATDQNHAMFGTIEEFLSQGIAGIIPPTEPGTTPGWKHIRIAPMILQHLDWAEGSAPTPAGRVRSRWEKLGQRLVVEIDVPAGATATLEVPAAFWLQAENGKPMATILVPLSAGLHRINVAEGKAIPVSLR